MDQAAIDRLNASDENDDEDLRRLLNERITQAITGGASPPLASSKGGPTVERTAIPQSRVQLRPAGQSSFVGES